MTYALLFLAVMGWLLAFSMYLLAKREREWRIKAMAGWQGCNLMWRDLCDALTRGLPPNIEVEAEWQQLESPSKRVH